MKKNVEVIGVETILRVKSKKFLGEAIRKATNNAVSMFPDQGRIDIELGKILKDDYEEGAFVITVVCRNMPSLESSSEMIVINEGLKQLEREEKAKISALKKLRKKEEPKE